MTKLLFSNTAITVCYLKDLCKIILCCKINDWKCKCQRELLLKLIISHSHKSRNRKTKRDILFVLISFEMQPASDDMRSETAEGNIVQFN